MPLSDAPGAADGGESPRRMQQLCSISFSALSVLTERKGANCYPEKQQCPQPPPVRESLLKRPKKSFYHFSHTEQKMEERRWRQRRAITHLGREIAHSCFKTNIIFQLSLVCLTSSVRTAGENLGPLQGNRKYSLFIVPKSQSGCSILIPGLKLEKEKERTQFRHCYCW